MLEGYSPERRSSIADYLRPENFNCKTMNETSSNLQLAEIPETSKIKLRRTRSIIEKVFDSTKYSSIK